MLLINGENMKETIEAKLKVLEDNNEVSEQIRSGEQLLTKAKADLNALWIDSSL